jgi:AcrR family transcriptional regulator
MSASTREPPRSRIPDIRTRIVDAAQKLLGQKSFDAIALDEIADEAQVTLGQLIAAYPNRDSILAALEPRLEREFGDLVDESLESALWDKASAEEALTNHHLRLVRLYQKWKWLARALVLRDHAGGNSRRHLDRINSRMLPRIARHLLERIDVGHPRPEQAVEFALLAVRSICREVVLFGANWPGSPEPPSAEELAAELTRLFLEHLQTDPSRLAAHFTAAASQTRTKAGTPTGGPTLERIGVRADGILRIIKTTDVDFFESQGNYVALHAGTARYMVRTTIGDIESQLDPTHFVRIHRRFIINLDRVREVHPWFSGDAVVVMTSGVQLRLSRSYRDRFHSHIGGDNTPGG